MPIFIRWPGWPRITKTESYTCTHMWMKAWYPGGKIPIPILSEVLRILFWSFRKWLEPSFLPFIENKYSTIEFRTLTSTTTALDDSAHCIIGEVSFKHESWFYIPSLKNSGVEIYVLAVVTSLINKNLSCLVINSNI